MSDAQSIIYFDNNATTKTDADVLDAMLPYYTTHYGNASSMHTFGGKNKKHVDEARAKVASLLGAEHESEIIFTSGGTESDNAAIRSAIALFPERKHFITTRIEHPAVLALAKTLETKGFRVTYLAVDKHGLIDLDELARELTDETALVSIMWANNETGAIQPVEEAARICKARGVLFHTDAVQAIGRIPMDLAHSAIDMLSLSSHKFHGPKGIGALYVRRGVRFRPLITGGHQERGRRAGTENIPGVVGLGRAAVIAKEQQAEDSARIKILRDKLEKGILDAIDDTHVNCAVDARLPNTTNISFGFVEGEAILLLLNEQGICASSGSACSSGSLEPSHVLRAMGVPFTHAHGSIRFSLSRYSTEAEVDAVIAAMPPIINRLREISPYYKMK